MKAIKHTLTERWYAWENARWAAMEDPAIDLYADEEQGQKVYDATKEVQQVCVCVDRSSVLVLIDIQQDAFEKAEAKVESEQLMPPPVDEPRAPEARV